MTSHLDAELQQLGEPAGPDALAQEHEDLLAFLYAAPVGLVQTDLDGQVELMNAVTAMLLMPVSIQTGQGMDNLFSLLEPLAPDLRARVAALGDQMGTVCEDLRLPLSHAGEAPRHGALRLVRLDARRLIATVTDITAQVLAEQGRQQAEERLRFAMQSAQVGDWVMDVASGRIDGSALHDRCFGRPPVPAPSDPSAPSATGDDWHLEALLARVHPDDQAAVRDSLARALQESSAWRSEFRVRWDDASEHWLAMHGRPVRRPDAPPQLAGVVLDTTHEREADALRRHTDTLARENRHLQETSQLKSKFVATMSHELRSPLTSILGFTELLRGGVATPGTPEFDECMERIAGNGQHLLRLINDVLDLSKIEAGKLDFRPAPLALGALANDARAAMAPQWQKKQQTVVLEVADGLEHLQLDASRLRQVIYNLLSNAVKFTPVGGTVTLRAWPEDGPYFVLEVIDTGIGIAAEDLPRLFGEFAQLDGGRDRAHEGTGLGLALTRRLVQAQGGDIGVRSTPGQGSSFRVQLPRVHDGVARPAAD